MNNITKYVGMDVSKATIAVAIADEGREAPRFYGTILNSPESVKKFIKSTSKQGKLFVCYEAGPTGYGLYRLLLSLGIECTVIAPSLTPQRPGDRVKTDRRDALRLAQLLRAGELTSIYVPTEEDEALRDLVRIREDMKEDQLRSRHRLTKFLLRHDLHQPEGVRRWTQNYRKWLDSLDFENPCLRITFQEYLHKLDEAELSLQRLEAEIHNQATESPKAPLIQALQSLRGVAEITATSLVAEIGTFQRFSTPRQFMGYIGLVPSEFSTGQTRRQGSLTKTGNRHVRRLLVESAWSYRYKPALKGNLKKRQENQNPEVQSISWKAQNRLHTKYSRMTGRGKEKGKVVAAVARELAGFIWAIGQRVE